MGTLDSIATIATLAVGGLVFLKVYPLVEGFLKGGEAGAGFAGFGDFIDQFIPRPVYEGPLRTKVPVEPGDVRYKSFEELTTAPSGEPVFYEHPVISAEDYEAREAAFREAAFVEVVQSAVIPPVPYAYNPPPLPPAEEMHLTIAPVQAPGSGQFWVNPLTQAVLAPYVQGQTPASVSALRLEDIFASIRRF